MARADLGRWRGGIIPRRTYFRERVYRQPGAAEVGSTGYGGADSTQVYSAFLVGSSIDYSEHYHVLTVPGAPLGPPNGIEITHYIASAGRSSTAFFKVLLYDVGGAAGLKQMRLMVDQIAFYDGVAPVSRQTVVGAKGGNVALANLCTALAALGLIVDGTT